MDMEEASGSKDSPSEPGIPSADINKFGQTTSVSPPALPRIGGFTILHKVYEGSVCTVFKARQDRLGRLVALKLLREWPPPSDVQLERFNRSTYVYAQALHANVPVLYESGTSDGYHYTALEYVPGQTLQEILEERSRLSERRTVWIALQVARALVALHEKGIVHRNVKPKNILIDPECRVRLVGTGLAKCDAPCFSKNLDAQAIGTPHYMAPEIIRGCCTDPRSDLYSLGVTMYVMVVGRPPFEKGVPALVMAKHLYEKARPLANACPGLSKDFVELVERMMAKCPHERLASSKEAVAKLELMAAKHFGGRVPGERAQLPPAPAYVPPSPAGQVAWRAAALFCAALLLVFGAGLVFLGTLKNNPPTDSPPANTAPKNDKLPQAPPDANEPAPGDGQAAQERRLQNEFRRLLELDPVFRRNSERGIREWNQFLRDFPEAPQALRDEAGRRVRQYAQPAPPRAVPQDRLQQDVERLEF